MQLLNLNRLAPKYILTCARVKTLVKANERASATRILKGMILDVVHAMSLVGVGGCPFSQDGHAKDPLAQSAHEHKPNAVTTGIDINDSNSLCVCARDHDVIEEEMCEITMLLKKRCCPM